jgi:hypothetical protein
VQTKGPDGGRRNFNVKRVLVAMKLAEGNVVEWGTPANNEANSKAEEPSDAYQGCSQQGVNHRRFILLS